MELEEEEDTYELADDNGYEAEGEGSRLFIPALLFAARCLELTVLSVWFIIGLPNILFAWPMLIFHGPTLVATCFVGPVLLIVMSDLTGMP